MPFLKITLSQNSVCHDDKFNFVLEASRRSNMICLQLYTKEIDAFPGESAASSIFSRHLNDRGGALLKHTDMQFQERVKCLCTWRDLMARLHDESLRYVLSDHAIVAVADKLPQTPREIHNTILQADQNVESLSANFPLASPSDTVCSHLLDLYELLQDKIHVLDDFVLTILQKHMGKNGSCPLSLYNYSLLSKSNLKLTKTIVSKRKVVKNPRQNSRKSSRELFVQKFSCKAPVYHNCRIYASDGRLLCYCDRRKLDWYVRRDLAKVVDENPPAIMLLFEPKGRPEDEDNDFYIQSKKNICVSCGEGNHYLRYRVIPSCYRIHFPEHLKSHRSHDIVLLCVDCHEVAHCAAEKYKKKIACEFGIPLFVQKVVNPRKANPTSGLSVSILTHEEGVSPIQLRTAAMALLRHGTKMPSKRREELTQIVLQYYGGREISNEDLEKALLVGMSPHERRRLEKKRGMSFKRSSDSVLPDKEEHESNSSMNTCAISDTLKPDRVANFHENKVKAHIGEDGVLPIAMNTDISNSCVFSDSEFNEEALTSDKLNTNSDAVESSGTMEVHDLITDEQCESRSLSNGTLESYYSQNHCSKSTQYNPKLSLLGHGPHGKQVVDHLLREYGEDGVSQFCQRWRLVFVEALHPQFLPAGWDVRHSGRREFGEYSVYNPSNKSVDGLEHNDF